MATTLISAFAVFLSTSIDYIIILVVLFSKFKKQKNGVKNIGLGQYLGLTILIVISLLAASGLAFFSQKWIGLLGLLPIYIGLKELFKSEDEEDQDRKEILESTSKFSKLFLSVTVISLAAGGDNLGVYIPYFTTLNIFGLSATIIIFYVLSAVLLYICYRLSTFKAVSETVEKYQRIIVPIVFVPLGIMIMYENGTFSMLVNLF
ncbi:MULTISPECIES: CadD family cadmium resistance transporter [Oceanobacillus]|jgi:cadmium resistance transport/sequestration family protein|uniref:CadD family cadmium resistance transporter n=2 Tax=Oceanobacillus TaxID=182709 RepID=A0AAW5B5I7_9BACI|nr:CadD family cadmium resistance transporter [Oceanobacillus jordanicus]MCG3419710.1 CadD family cadmium resistance transporter [Oceanobacillus jordanicus]